MKTRAFAPEAITCTGASSGWIPIFHAHKYSLWSWRQQSTKSSTTNVPKEILHNGHSLLKMQKESNPPSKSQRILSCRGVSICRLQHSNPTPPTLSIWCKVPLVMSPHLNAQMCTKMNITGAPIPKQCTLRTYINIQMHPNKIKSAFRKKRKWLEERFICFEMRIATGTTLYFVFRLASIEGARALAVMRMCQPMKKKMLKTCNQGCNTDTPEISP